MWDFSWLERRWPGGGYENWNLCLDELTERGYNAVRIDAYPHLISTDPKAEWTITPPWKHLSWGAAGTVKVRPQPSLNTFVRKCWERDIYVVLSSWFQNDLSRINTLIASPVALAEAWSQTLDSIAQDDLLDAILFVDICNEWPGPRWAPFFNRDGHYKWKSPLSVEWMRESIHHLRKSYPEFPYTFSCVGANQMENQGLKDLSFLDLMEPHIWLAHANDCEFTSHVDYSYEQTTEHERLELNVSHLIPLYARDKDYWNQRLQMHIDEIINESVVSGLPLATSECWGIVDCKDFPMFDWAILKEMCAYGVAASSRTGRWLANASSNFCGPQFRGMWEDIEWHQEMTRQIRSAALPQQAMKPDAALSDANSTAAKACNCDPEVSVKK